MVNTTQKRPKIVFTRDMFPRSPQDNIGSEYTTVVSSEGTRFQRVLRDPKAAFGVARALIRGQIFTLWCRAFRPRIRIGRKLYLDGRLKIRGPGSVIIGDHVNIGMLVTPFTYSPEATIRIGDRAFLNGARFGCKYEINVGARCILGDCRVLDYDFHSVDPDHRNDPDYIKGAPITIEENVWITPDSIVQKGVRIGKNSTITMGSVVRNDIPPETIAGGNPAVVLKTLSVR